MQTRYRNSFLEAGFTTQPVTVITRKTHNWKPTHCNHGTGTATSIITGVSVATKLGKVLCCSAVGLQASQVLHMIYTLGVHVHLGAIVSAAAVVLSAARCMNTKYRSRCKAQVISTYDRGLVASNQRRQG